MDALLEQMSSETRKLTCHNNNISGQLHTVDPGTAHFELSEKTIQIDSEFLDNRQRVLSTGETSSLIDGKSPKVSDSMTGNFVIQLSAQPQCDLDKPCQTEEVSCLQHNTLGQAVAVGMDAASSEQMSSETRKVTCHNHNTSKQLQTLDPGTAHFKLSEKTNQIGSDCLDNEQKVLGTGETSSLLDEKSPKFSDGEIGNSIVQLPAEIQCGLDKSCQMGEGSCLQNNTFEPGGTIGMDASSDQVSIKTRKSTCHDHKTAEQLCTIDPETAHFELSEKTNQIGSEYLDNEQRALGSEETSFLIHENSSKVSDSLKGSSVIQLSARPQCDLDESCQTGEGSCLQCDTLEQVSGSSSSDKSENKHKLASQIVQNEPAEKSDDPPFEDTTKDNDGKKRRGSKTKNMGRQGVTDEFSRIKARLRYLLKRVSYEQNLIDAYSGEGWKGHSMEKLKPEKELQRAKSEILRLKLKIRDLFQHLDTLCAEGRLPESLFDSDGEICSEDIFCAKCRSKDLTAGNDIILCDGACDRGFHQFCLEPPLLTENIPPDDEGWLCPGCDCKDDCLDLLNDSLGTRLSVTDTWERVFPEAAAGNKVDPNLGLSSDDSDDGDYNPDVAEDEEVEGGKSSSDESENSSASEEMEVSHSEDPYLGLPSEDSEDDDFDPNAVEHDKDVAEESSISDFTSDSEDLGYVIKVNTFSGQDNDPISASSLLELDACQEASTPVSGRRQIERLDYKKLYDETYQNAQSDTSDDEDWTETTTSCGKRKFTGRGASVSPNQKASILGHMQKETAHTPWRNTHQNEVENSDNSPSKSLEGSRNSGANDKKPVSSTYKRLGEDAVKVLYKSFKENQYPDRATKESLAQELGLTSKQVSKWFGNARWSFRNSSRMEAIAGKKKSPQPATSSRVENEIALGDEERDTKSVSREGSVQKSKTPSSRKRKQISDSQGSDANIKIDITRKNSPAGSPRVSEVQRSHKKKTRNRR